MHSVVDVTACSFEFLGEHMDSLLMHLKLSVVSDGTIDQGLGHCSYASTSMSLSPSDPRVARVAKKAV